MKTTIRLSIFLVLGAILSSCGAKDKKADQGAAAAVKSYKVSTLSPISTTIYTDYPASIQGQENIEIRPRVDGYVEKIYVDEGAVVSKGQPLFKINAPQYEQAVRTANASIMSAVADVNAALMAVNKVKPLVEKDIISKFELESAQYNLQAKQALLAQAKAALANAQTNLGYTVVSSPVNGVVGSIPFRLGSLVSSNTATPLTTVSSIGNVFAYFAMNEKELLDFAKDGNLSFSQKIARIPAVSLLLSDGSLYEKQGRIQTVNGLINTATGSADVRASFANPTGIIRSGSSATVRIPSQIKDKLLIPQSATYELQDKRMAVIVDANGKTSSVAITTLQKAADKFYVVESGLKAGDIVVLEGVAALKDGTQIKPEMVNTNNMYVKNK
ncbi:MAG: efflux RND transporter periplasmic adaptor subunit [Bacteroidota bacterium]